jgi:HEAT repeat protein
LRCDDITRLAAAMALGRLGDVRVLRRLLRLLRDEDFDVRLLAAKSLGQLGDARAVEPLLQSLRDSDESSLRAQVLAALRKLVAIHRTKAPDVKLRRHLD